MRAEAWAERHGVCERVECGLLLQACGVPPSIHTHLGSTNSGMRHTHEHSFSLHTTTLHKKKHTKTPHYSKQTLTHHSCPRRDQSTLHTMTVKRTPDISYVREGRFEISGSGKVRKVNRFSYSSITIEIQFSQHKPLHLLLAFEGFRVHQPVP